MKWGLPLLPSPPGPRLSLDHAVGDEEEDKDSNDNDYEKVEEDFPLLLP